MNTGYLVHSEVLCLPPEDLPESITTQQANKLVQIIKSVINFCKNGVMADNWRPTFVRLDILTLILNEFKSENNCAVLT